MKALALLCLLAAPAWAAVKITDLREKCTVLTSSDVTELAGHKILERKPGLLYKVRHLCELQEALYDASAFPDAKLWNELDLIYTSFIDRHRVEAGVSLLEVLGMGLSHDLSPYLLRYPKTPEVPAPVIDDTFWSPPAVPLHAAFDAQVARAGVQTQFTWLRIDKLEGKGSVPKVHADEISSGGRWLLKWGDEMHSDPVASRIFAALGYDVDLPFFRGPGSVKLLLGKQSGRKRTVKQLVNFIHNSYSVNLSPFILRHSTVTALDVSADRALAPYLGESYLEFQGVALEPRPRNETRLGPMMLDLPANQQRVELRGAVLAHVWIGNWDTKASNTLLRLVEDGGQLKAQGSFSDLGVSLGVSISKFPRDLKAGLVNQLSWDVLELHDGAVHFKARMNHIPQAWRTATWGDLVWMAKRIALITEADMTEMLRASGWPEPLQTLYRHKLGNRRAQILAAFGVADAHPWTIDRSFDFVPYIVAGELVAEPDRATFPEGLWQTAGRFRGYGW